MTQDITVNSSPDLARGVYSNRFDLHFSPEDLRMDFFAIYGNQGSHVARIVMTPAQALRLSQSLATGINETAKAQGTVIKPAPDTNQQKIGFQPTPTKES